MCAHLTSAPAGTVGGGFDPRSSLRGTLGFALRAGWSVASCGLWSRPTPTRPDGVGRDDGSGARQGPTKTSPTHREVLGLGPRAQLATGRQAASCARPCSDIRRRRERILGRIRRAVTESCWGPMRLVRYWSSPPLIRGSARALKTNGGPPASRGALVVRAPGKGPAGIPPALVISSVSSRRV